MAFDTAHSTLHETFGAELVKLRPALHRYAARMVGSALDGEDVVQEAIARAVAALDWTPPEAAVAPWLFRITHNAAVDFLRGRKRHAAARDVADDDLVSGAEEASRRLAARAALSVFMRLSPPQRGAVILKDVLGYSNEEVADILGTTLAAAKAALHRGRTRLRLFADEPAMTSGVGTGDLVQLQRYIDRFNARDFDAIRTMLADDVRFDLVARLQGGRSAFEVYFGRYAELAAWHLSLGRVDGRLAVIVTNPTLRSPTPINVIDIAWADGRIARLRDFFHAGYVLDGADIVLLG
jgi:RNA polymerase sigma-70 factor (ECF subfamily)